MNAVVARAPIAWPLLRRPMRNIFDGMAAGWNERIGTGSADHLAALAAGLLHVKPEPERALDLGTGTGAAALLVAREFPRARVRGVDLSEEMIRRAKAHVGLDPEGRIAFKVADSSDLPYGEDSFDLVTLLNMPPFFAEIARVLRPGGHVVVAASRGSSTPFYTPEAVLRRGFRRQGLEIVETGSAGPGTYLVARLPA
jgi:SAM-dependent methyltransferase